MARSNKNQAKNETNTTKSKYVSVRSKPWHDLQDDGYVYKQGDIFPREGLDVSEDRIKELSTINNKLKEILIQKVEIEEDSTETENVEGNETTEDAEVNNVEESIEDSEDDSIEEEKEKIENIEE